MHGGDCGRVPVDGGGSGSGAAQAHAGRCHRDASLANSHRLAELQARKLGAEATEAGRGAASMPSISLLGGYTRTNHVPEFRIVQLGQVVTIYPDVPDNLRSRVDLNWPVYSGEYRRARARRRGRTPGDRGRHHRRALGSAARSDACLLGARVGNRGRACARQGARHHRRPRARSPQSFRSGIDRAERSAHCRGAAVTATRPGH